MTSPTLPELDAQLADIQRQRDIAALPGLIAVQAVLSKPATAKVADDLEALLDQLPASTDQGTPRNQAQNVINVIRQVTAHFDREVTRVQALAEPEATEE